MRGASAAVNSLAWREPRLERLLLGLLALALLFAVIVLCVGLFQPLLDQYDERQTQTALTAYWLIRGGPIFAYETPVLGFPWSIPFEFPLYQIIVAVVSDAGVPLDAAGRIVSFVFFVGCLWPAYVLFRALKFEKVAFTSVAILFVLCPLYLFWGRTFMIETCALFFCLCWLAYFATYLAAGTSSSAILAMVAGALGIAAKATTFPAFAILGGLIFVKECHAAWIAGLLAKRVRFILLALFVFAVPFLIGGAWTAYSDMVRNANEVFASLTRAALTEWIFGTWEERISPPLWRDVIFTRALKDAFGNAGIPALAVIAATMLHRRYANVALAAIIAYLVPFIVFTHVHVVHNYYQSANTILIVAAAGLGVASVMGAGRRGIGLILLLLIAAGQIVYFKSAYAGLLTADLTGRPDFRVAQMARAQTPPGSGLLVIGRDWSATIGYYAQRKSLTVPEWMPFPFWQRMAAEPQNFLAPASLGAIVVCTDYALKDDQKALIDRLVAGRRVLGEAGDCTLYGAEMSGGSKPG